MDFENYESLIGGKWRVTSDKMPVHFPYNGEKVAEIFVAGEKEVEEASPDPAQRGFIK